MPRCRAYFGAMRDLESIDDELALIAEVQRELRADGWSFSTWQVDGLLDERLRAVYSRAALAIIARTIDTASSCTPNAHAMVSTDRFATVDRACWHSHPSESSCATF